MKLHVNITRLAGALEITLTTEGTHRFTRRSSNEYKAERLERLEMALEAVVQSPDAAEDIANAALGYDAEDEDA